LGASLSIPVLQSVWNHALREERAGRSSFCTSCYTIPI
jgi:hypothetical protein